MIEAQSEMIEVQSELQELVKRRATVQQWLERLESQRGTVSPAIIERVRADYQKRLLEANEALAEHQGALASDLERSRARLSEAEERHAAALDRFEEGRLRSLIGELDDTTWASSRKPLENDVESAGSAVESARAEVSRLQELLQQLSLDSRGRDVVPIQDGKLTESPSAAVDAEVTIAEPVPIIAPTEVIIADPDATIAEPELSAVDKDPFLDGLDRALTAAGSRIDNSSVALDSELPAEDTAPKPGLKCAECGYTNDLSAWFCGVCGADVG